MTYQVLLFPPSGEYKEFQKCPRIWSINENLISFVTCVGNEIKAVGMPYIVSEEVDGNDY